MRTEGKDEREKNNDEIITKELEELFKEFSDSPHKPVMPREVLSFIPSDRKLKVIDATVGCGGHSSLILKKNPEAVLLGLDRDSTALSFAQKKLAFAKERVQLIKSNFSQIRQCAADAGWTSADIILLDLGLSSLQLDDPSRGFSFTEEARLDMRMDLESEETAEWILKNYSKERLIELFRDYGEIKRPKKLVEEILTAVKNKKMNTTKDLADICRKIPGLSRFKGLRAPTLCFQALRIAVNDELNELKKCLQEGIKLLSHGGKFIIISFNSLEDRIVKNFFRTFSSPCTCPPYQAQCTCTQISALKILTKKPLTPQLDEIKLNRRAASAKLRAAEKTSNIGV